MTCETVKLPGGQFAIVCGSGRRGTKPKRCSCGNASTKLCDFPRRQTEISGGIQRLVHKTCDKPLCDGCAIVVGEDRDHCPDHPAVPSQLSLGAL